MRRVYWSCSELECSFETASRLRALWHGIRTGHYLHTIFEITDEEAP